jgi:hypothetical protein
MKTLIGTERSETLKKKFLQCMGFRTTNATALREVVKGLVDQGVSRKTLVLWALQAGYTKAYVSSLLSRILCAIGFRERLAGAGRKPSPDALELLAHAQAKYGGKSLNVLRAALRAGRTQATAGIASFEQQSGKAAALIVAPQLRNQRANCGTTIKRNRNTAPSTSLGVHPSAGNIFKRNGNRT